MDGLLILFNLHEPFFLYCYTPCLAWRTSTIGPIDYDLLTGLDIPAPGSLLLGNDKDGLAVNRIINPLRRRHSTRLHMDW
jgi:hypothetical protein